ncbi:helix-turn-helix transcriptional regulator [Gordonia humi]|uniref:helix-turn-helix domain-containing protein n=1 Tax=Gordonia humi TaxID=686429 RepID=UPI0031E8623F
MQQEGPTVKREIQYQWRVREHMARVGMKNSRDLVEPLRDRGITLSESQIYRIVGQEPERIAFSVLAALCDIFGVEAGDLVTYTAIDSARRRDKRAVNSPTDVPLLDAYRPVRARIVDDDD